MLEVHFYGLGIDCPQPFFFAFDTTLCSPKIGGEDERDKEIY